jgi:hypothetical protein
VALNPFVYFYARLAHDLHSYARLWRLANSGNGSGEAHNVDFSTGRQMFKGEHKSAHAVMRREGSRRISPSCRIVGAPAVKREAEEDWGRR